jgi:alpha-N-arabinofuranosidase
MRLIQLSVLISLLSVAVATRADESANSTEAPIHIKVNAEKTGPPINPFIYGQFIEHLGRCIYGGIWAEMLEDRKFYYPISEKYAPYGDLKNTNFPVVSASPWQATGPAGSVTMVSEQPFSGEHTPRIAAEGGIQQNDLAFMKGAKYVGRIRLHCPTGRSGMKILLVCGDSAADHAVHGIDVGGTGYQEYAFSFVPTRTTTSGRLAIEVIADGKPCLIGAVSLMPADNVRGFRRDTLDLLKQLNAPIYRWPGGNFVSGYDWRDGIGPRDRRPTRKNPAWTGIDSNDVGIDEFLDLCHEIGAEPMIAVNTGFGDDYSAAQEVEYANGGKETIGGQWRVDNGHISPYSVRYWCVGNEMFGKWQLGHMELSQYLLKHKRFAAAMRKVDPKLILVGSGDLGTKATLSNGRPNREVNWSEGLLEQCGDEMDFISEHFYKGRTPWGEQPPKELPSYVALLKDEIRSKAKSHRELQSKMGRTPDRFMPIAMDEWNYWHTGYIYGELGCEYSLADALGIAAGLHEYFRNGDIIHMANYAQTVNVIGCIKTTKTAAFFDTTALPLLLYRREFGTAPLEVTGNQSDRSLDVVAAKTKDGRAITIGVVNPQSKSQSMQVKFDGVKPGSSATVWRISGSDPTAHNTADKQGVAIVEEKNVPFGDQLTVPAHSVNLYRVPTE